MGINWWESDPRLAAGSDDDRRSLAKRVEALERRLGDDRSLTSGEDEDELRKRIKQLERQLERASADE
jgi:hypothetical protein